jgi:aspartate/methionine/tyrosine aminotransferase
MHFTREVSAVTESPMVQIATIAERMPGSVKLCYGESDLPTPQFICDAATEAMRAGHTFYTHTAGYGALREAIAAKVKELHAVEYTPSEIMATVGATSAIFTAIRAFVRPGDNAVVVTPTYAIFSNGVLMSGGEPRPVSLMRVGRRFALDLDRVRAAIDARTRMLIVNSPSNPTGWVISEDEQRALCALADRHDLVILADEVYERLVYDAPLAPSFARVMPSKDRVIVVNSFSKSYNMTGWRLGWAQASEQTIRVMYKAAEFITSNPAAMVQQAGIVALREGEPHLRELRAHYEQRRLQVTRALADIPSVSVCDTDGAFYAFFSVAGVADSTAFTSRLVEATGLALTPGAAFGEAGEGYIRLCYAASEPTITDAMQRFTRFMAAFPASTGERNPNS